MKVHTRGMIIAIAAFLVSASTASAQTCPSPSSPITPADRAAATAAGIPTTINCWNPSDPQTGKTAGDAKLWLQAHASKNANISCLNSTYAERLKALMENVPGGPPTIDSAYRSPQEQANLPPGSTQVGPCGSYHQYGMAADFNLANAQTQQWMRQNASRYGLAPVTNANPMTGCTPRGFCDGGHIQIAGEKPPLNQCGICSATGPGTSGTIPGIPAPARGYYSDIPGSTPTNPFQNPNTPFMPPSGMQQPPPQTPPPQTPPQQNQPTPIPLPNASSSIFTIPPPYSFPLPTTTSPTGTTTWLSSYQQIQNIVTGGNSNISTPTPTSTSSPTKLNDNLHDIVGDGRTGGTNQVDDIPPNTLAVNSVPVPPVGVTQTFSNSQQPTSSGSATADASTPIIVAALTTIRDFLASYLSFLKSGQTYGFQGSWQLPR